MVRVELIFFQFTDGALLFDLLVLQLTGYLGHVRFVESRLWLPISHEFAMDNFLGVRN